ncbi:TetR/AcrR family transcriptional regulator [Motilimonas pumila]|uniref:TetR/AcrR family transcriptional regulator n=1 Tax=Motilimonas pumila TaxID=2303987 RepID=A0A418YCE0_9GAMM|nr:TetR/AcrR family transcriptional regulator [Motilimonas pumila]RJG42157.1 TetR/AcrR family transcriptional regulator [Motilimonas pumila]
MANKAKFNRSDVVEKATNLYWEKGFNGTSMRNLQDAIDLRPGSIYATFGSKEGLFKESLSHYAAAGEQQLQQCLQQTDSVLEALMLFTRRIVVDSQQSSPSGMCMLQKTVAELTDEQSELLAFAQQLMHKMEQKFAELLQQAIVQGELAPDKNPAYLARHLQIQILGLRNYARVQHDHLEQAELLGLVDATFKQAPFK